MAKKSIYYAQLERFGYMLVTVGDTAEHARKTLRHEYLKTYVQWNNGELPTLDELRCMDDEMYIEKVEYNQVLWL